MTRPFATAARASVVKLVVVVLAGLLVLWAALQVIGLLPKLNPFGTDTVDRSQPALLESVRDLSRYQAAEGNFQVIVDVEKDVRFVPGFLAGERGLFVGAGTVGAYVDFTGLTEEGLKVDEEAKRVTVTLPPAQLDKPNLDPSKSYLVYASRGLLERVQAAVDDPDVQNYNRLAEEKIAAAAAESELTKRASDNTKSMLTGLFRSLGYETTFTGDPS